MSNKSTIGRPRLPKGKVKEVFAIRLTPADRRAIEAAAKLAGQRATEWARNAMINAV
jgi:uncharacterized protein (DUF1778 family)